jgi:hypothetical protein
MLRSWRQKQIPQLTLMENKGLLMEKKVPDATERLGVFVNVDDLAHFAFIFVHT